MQLILWPSFHCKEMRKLRGKWLVQGNWWAMCFVSFSPHKYPDSPSRVLSTSWVVVFLWETQVRTNYKPRSLTQHSILLWSHKSIVEEGVIKRKLNLRARVIWSSQGRKLGSPCPTRWESPVFIYFLPLICVFFFSITVYIQQHSVTLSEA